MLDVAAYYELKAQRPPLTPHHPIEE